MDLKQGRILGGSPPVSSPRPSLLVPSGSWAATSNQIVVLVPARKNAQRKIRPTGLPSSPLCCLSLAQQYRRSPTRRKFGVAGNIKTARGGRLSKAIAQLHQNNLMVGNQALGLWLAPVQDPYEPDGQINLSKERHCLCKGTKSFFSDGQEHISQL